MRKIIIALLVAAVFSSSHAGSCLITGGKKIGDCGNVNVGSGKPLNVKTSGVFTGNYTHVIVQSGVTADISGNTDEVLVLAGATLYLTGNSGKVRVEGIAELSGNSGWVHSAKGGKVTIRGIADGVSGPGQIIKVPGAIIGRIYIN
jgi:hypothetical protein